MRKRSLFTVLGLVLLCTVPAFAQAGCDDSPENPTLILAALAGGVFSANSLRTRFRARRRPPQEN